MISLTIEPTGQIIEVNPKETLLRELKRNGIDIKSKCGGHASCADCIIKVKSSSDCFSAMRYEEKSLLGNVFHIGQCNE
jgi:ferredoxin